MNEFRNRVKDFIKHSNKSVRQFEAKCGLSNGAVSKMDENTRKSTVDKILAAFPELSRTWLLTGEGSMLISEEKERASAASNLTALPLMSAEHPNGVTTIEALLLPHEYSQRDKYVIIEMPDGELATRIKQGAVFLAKEIPEGQWEYAEGTVAVIFADRLTVRRVYRNNLMGGDTLMLENDNGAILTIKRDDIHSIYKAKRIISSTID